MDKFFYVTKMINGELNWRENYLNQMLIFKTEEALTEYMIKDGFTKDDFDIASDTPKDIVTEILVSRGYSDESDTASDELIERLFKQLTEISDDLEPRKD